jgi:Domain of unknown function (DUF4915)
VLLVGGISHVGAGTGLYSFDGELIQKIDSLPTAGVQKAGPDYLVRMLCSDADPHSPGELLVYDTVGVARYARIPDLSDLHDLIWDGESIVCSATGNNKIVWLSLSGEVKRTWSAPGENDAWHLNGLCFRDGKTYFSAFGMYANHRGWNGQPLAHAGIIYNLTEDKLEIKGLDCPHNPNLTDDGWVVCNSALNEFLHLQSGTGLLKNSLQLNGWTRGFANSDAYFFVGESANRKKLTVGASAHLCIVARATWEIAERISFPITEVTFLSLVPKHFLAGLRRGFRTNAYRETVYNIHELFRNTGTDNLHLLTTSDPLPMDAFSIKISARVPENVAADTIFTLSVSLENLGTGVLASRPPCPVHFTYAWFEVTARSEVQVPGEALRTRLPRVVPPHYSLEWEANVLSPKQPGTYRLQVTLVQEFVGTFTQVNPDNAYTATVRVDAKDAKGRVSAAIAEALKVFTSK